MLPLIAQGLVAAAPFAAQLFGKKQHVPNINAINQRYMGMRPEGYISPEDQRFSDQLLNKGNQLAGAQASEATRGLERRATPFGYSPGARERAIGLINQQKVGQLENAKFGADSALYGAFNSNKNFERQKMMTGWGAELGNARDVQSRRDLQNSTFWNSAMEYIPNALKLFGGGDMSAAPTDLGPGTRGNRGPGTPIDTSGQG